MKKLGKSFVYAFCGILTAITEERNMRIHLAFLFYVILFGCITGIAGWQWAAVLLCAALVLGLEMLNTALEHLCDEVQGEWSEHIRKAKDTAAGGVLLAAVLSSVVGGIVFFRAERMLKLWNFIVQYPWACVLICLTLPAWILFVFRFHRREKEKL